MALRFHAPPSELTASVQRGNTEHQERKAVVQDKITQREQLLAERTRIEDNIKRMQQVRRGAVVGLHVRFSSQPLQSP